MGGSAPPRRKTMELSPREKDKLLVFTAACSPNAGARAA
jgi:hypothetical protein